MKWGPQLTSLGGEQISVDTALAFTMAHLSRFSRSRVHFKKGKDKK